MIVIIKADNICSTLEVDANYSAGHIPEVSVHCDDTPKFFASISQASLSFPGKRSFIVTRLDEKSLRSK